MKSETRIKIGFWSAVVILMILFIGPGIHRLVIGSDKVMFVGGILLIIGGLFLFGGFAFAVNRKLLKISLFFLFLIGFSLISGFLEILEINKGNFGVIIISMSLALIILFLLSQAVIGIYQQMKEKVRVNAISIAFGITGGIIAMGQMYETKRELQYSPENALGASLLGGFFIFSVVFIIIRCFIFGFFVDEGGEKDVEWPAWAKAHPTCSSIICETCG